MLGCLSDGGDLIRQAQIPGTGHEATEIDQEVDEVDLETTKAGGSGGAIAPPIFLEIRKKEVFSTPNISAGVLNIHQA